MFGYTCMCSFSPGLHKGEAIRAVWMRYSKTALALDVRCLPFSAAQAGVSGVRRPSKLRVRVAAQNSIPYCLILVE